MNVLVVAAHPDDEVLGAGGTIARLAAAGHQVAIHVLGEGATSRVADRAEADHGEVDVLRAQMDAAAAHLGVTDVTASGLPDNRFDQLDLLDVVKLVEAQIERVEPTLVLSQHGGDVNVDHRTTFQAVLAATRPVPGNRVERVLTFEVGSSTEWAFHSLEPRFLPNVFVDITDHLDAKVAALLAYEGEVRDFPHPRSVESITAQAQRWGSAAGVRAAEAFCLLRAVV